MRGFFFFSYSCSQWFKRNEALRKSPRKFMKQPKGRSEDREEFAKQGEN